MGRGRFELLIMTVLLLPDSGWGGYRGVEVGVPLLGDAGLIALGLMLVGLGVRLLGRKP